MGSPVIFFDIGCKDKENTVKFYTELFGWTADDVNPYSSTVDTESEYGITGAVTALGHEPHNYCMIYLEVDDINAHLEKAESMGGKTLVPRTENPASGQFFAWMADPEGTMIGLLEPVDD